MFKKIAPLAVALLLPGCSSSTEHAKPQSPTSSPSHVRATTTVESSSRSEARPSSSENRPDGSRLEAFEVKGRKSGLTGRVLVWLPAGYQPSKKYPVIEMLHGYPGHPDSIFPSTHVDQQLDEEVDQHHLAAPIVVMPQENMPPSRDTECVDAPHEATGTWLGDDVPEFVRNTFPTRAGRDSWATWGFSAGGWCAAVVASQRPQTFGAAVSLVGYFKPDFEPAYVPFGPSSPQYKATDLVAMMKKSPPNIAYYVLAAKQDPVSYPTSAEFVAAARRPAVVQSHLMSHGDHSGTVWLPHMGESLAFLTVLKGFAPSTQ